MNNKLDHIKQSGFKTPKDYFDNLEDSIFDKLKLNSSLDNIDNPGFKVPKDYFSNIEDSVINTLKDDKKGVKVVSIFSKKNLLYYSGIAAAVVLMISIFKPSGQISFDSIETELVESYISNYNINSADLATLWSENDFNEIAFDDYEFLDTTVEDYILENSNIEDLLID